MTPTNAEQDTRRELAACYRLIDHFGMTDLVSTHVSARIPGSEDMLINPYGLLFGEVTASNLVRLPIAQAADDETANPAGYLIHSAIHTARADVACVLHTHTAHGVAVACQEGGLLPISQHALQFHERIGYHAYEGIALLVEEKARLTRDLGAHGAMILRNHGLLTVGRTVGEALTLMLNLERACRIQLLAQSSGARLTVVAADVCALAARQHEGFAGQPVGDAEWPALVRLVERIAPDYRD